MIRKTQICAMVVGCVWAALGHHGLAASQIVTVQFSGTIQVVDHYGLLPPEIATGGSFFGTLTYDAAGPFETGIFNAAIQRGLGSEYGLSLTIGEHEFVRNPSSESSLFFLDDQSPDAIVSPLGDNVLASTNGFSMPTLGDLDLLADEWHKSMSFTAHDRSGSTFSLDDLAAGLTCVPGQSYAFQLHAFSPSVTAIWPPRPLLGFAIVGRIDNLTSTVAPAAGEVGVPEPASIWLLFAATTAVVGLTFRRRCCAARRPGAATRRGGVQVNLS
jgi:hypothetical protein